MSGSAPGALSAFLRGIERRGYVFAEAQCGDPDQAMVALSAAMATFRAQAAAVPLPQWPRRFWQVLIGCRELHVFHVLRQTPDAVRPLAELTPGPRAALLLRLVAGLDEAHGAAVLGVSEGAFRQALGRAVAGLQGDEAALPALREALLRRVKTLPPERLQALSEQRERLLQGVPASAPPAGAARSAPRWLRYLLWIGVALCVLAFAATWFWPPGRAPTLRPGAVQALPEDPVPVLAPEASLLADPDFQQLADPAGAALSERLDFYAWLAADGDAQAAAEAENDDAP